MKTEDKKTKFTEFLNKNYLKLEKKFKKINANDDCINDVINYMIEYCYNNIEKIYDLLEKNDNSIEKYMMSIIKQSIYYKTSTYQRNYSINNDYRLHIIDENVEYDDNIYEIYKYSEIENMEDDILFDFFIKNKLVEISDYNEIILKHIDIMELNNECVLSINKDYIIFNYYIKRAIKDENYNTHKMSYDLKANRNELKRAVDNIFTIIKNKIKDEYNIKYNKNIEYNDNKVFEKKRLVDKINDKVLSDYNKYLEKKQKEKDFINKFK